MKVIQTKDLQYLHISIRNEELDYLNIQEYQRSNVRELIDKAFKLGVVTGFDRATKNLAPKVTTKPLV